MQAIVCWLKAECGLLCRYSETDWWTRERVGDYLPVLSLDEPSFIDYIQAAGVHLDVSLPPTTHKLHQS